MLFFVLILQVLSQENIALVRSLICGCATLSTDACESAEWCEIVNESCENKELDFNCPEYEELVCSENDWCEWNTDKNKCSFKQLLQCSDQTDQAACLAFSSNCRWNDDETCSAYSPQCKELMTQEECQSYFQDNMQCIWEIIEQNNDETVDQSKNGRCLKSQTCDNYEDEQCQLLANCNMNEGKCKDCTLDIYKQYGKLIGFWLLIYFYYLI